MSTSDLLTPQTAYPDLAAAVGVSSLYLKREDLHPLGSHKGRSIPHMIDVYLAELAKDDNSAHKKAHFVISSSGNAALAAGLYVKELNAKNAKENGANGTPNATPITLEILAGKNIAPNKLTKIQALRDDNITVAIHDRPLQVLTVKLHEDPSIKSLRQSTDDTALAGYEGLARELSQIPDLGAIFIGTSSGTTAQALAEYFTKKHVRDDARKENVQVHIVQTPSCHPISEAFGSQAEAATETDEKSIADAIVDQTAHRKDALVPLIEETGGFGWIADNESIRIARELVQKHAQLDVSTNSALSVAGLMNAVYTGQTWTGSAVCIIAGE